MSHHSNVLRMLTHSHDLHVLMSRSREPSWHSVGVYDFTLEGKWNFWDSSRLLSLRQRK